MDCVDKNTLIPRKQVIKLAAYKGVTYFFIKWEFYSQMTYKVIWEMIFKYFLADGILCNGSSSKFRFWILPKLRLSLILLL